MNLKMRLRPRDILKLFFGGTILIMCPYNSSIYRLQKGDDTYVCKQ